MQYSEIIYLLDVTKEVDEIGNVLPTSDASTKCYAKKQSVRTNEYYSSAEMGITPSMEFVIKRLNYNGETEIMWNNVRYQVIRTVDPKNKFDIVLVCAKKIGINGSVVPSA